MNLTTSKSKRRITQRTISGVVVRAAPFILQGRKRKFIDLKVPRLYPLILLEMEGRRQGRASSSEKGQMMESQLLQCAVGKRCGAFGLGFELR
jgi:hypothetical protein